VGPWASLDGCRKPHPHLDSITIHLARSESLYHLGYSSPRTSRTNLKNEYSFATVTCEFLLLQLCFIWARSGGCKKLSHYEAEALYSVTHFQHASWRFRLWQICQLTLHNSGFGGLAVSMLASGTRVRGFEPGRSRQIFHGEKILCVPSFGGEVKPSVPCRRFVAYKGTLHLVWNSPNDGKIYQSLIAHSSPFPARGLSRHCRHGGSWRRKLELLKPSFVQ
jgi:hypothetical protein